MDGGGGHRCAGDGDEKNGAGRRVSPHADQREQPCIFMKEQGITMEAIKFMEGGAHLCKGVPGY